MSYFHRLLGTFILTIILIPTGALHAENPVKDLEKAIKSGRKDILFEGKEKEDLKVRPGVKIRGTSRDKSVIYGDVILENGASLSNLTVFGKVIPVTVAKGASVTLTNVTVRGGTDVGILAPTGGGTLTINRSLITKNRKGLYILPGKRVNISGSSISGNKEEGLDMRQGTSGRIVGNQFLGNAEGGAEILVSGAALSIEGNTFSGNKASGLSFQSYPSQTTLGNIVVRQNTFVNNTHFGIVCKLTLKGAVGGAFFSKSVRSLGNTFRGNQDGALDGACGMANRAIVSEDTEAVPSAEEVAAALQAIAAENAEQRDRFEKKVGLLHAEEYALELELHQEGEMLSRMKRSFRPLSAETQQSLEAVFQRLEALREEIKNLPLPDGGETLIKEKRQLILGESVRRFEILRTTFERLQQPTLPAFPYTPLIFLF